VHHRDVNVHERYELRCRNDHFGSACAG
jgi:hypothetical protein